MAGFGFSSAICPINKISNKGFVTYLISGILGKITGEKSSRSESIKKIFMKISFMCIMSKRAKKIT
jgi:hypothetical protein